VEERCGNLVSLTLFCWLTVSTLPAGGPGRPDVVLITRRIFADALWIGESTAPICLPLHRSVLPVSARCWEVEAGGGRWQELAPLRLPGMLGAGGGPNQTQAPRTHERDNAHQAKLRSSLPSAHAAAYPRLRSSGNSG